MKENIEAYFYISGRSNNYILHYFIRNNTTKKNLIKLTRKLKEENFITANYKSLYYIFKDILSLMKICEIEKDSHIVIFTEVKKIKKALENKNFFAREEYKFIDFFLNKFSSYECKELLSIQSYIYKQKKPPIALYIKCKKAGKEYIKIINRNSTLTKLNRMIKGCNELVFFDFEMNCVGNFKDVEIVSIGAVKTDLNGKVLSKFYQYIKPKKICKLTDRCIEITAISQQDIDNAEYFEDVFKKLEKWCGKSRKVFLYWGGNDIAVLKNDYARINNKIKIVDSIIKTNIDYQEVLCKDVLELNDSLSLNNAVLKYNLNFKGKQHNSLDDAYNLSRLYFKEKERR